MFLCIFMCLYIIVHSNCKKMSDHDNCKVCNNDLTVNQKVALLFDSCNKWHCFSCMGVTKRCFDVLNNSKLDTSMVKVVCKQCLKDSCPISN